MSDAEQPEPGLPAQALASLPRPASGWSPVSNRILVRISGPGTDKFLQGQFSQHLDEVVPGFSPRAAAATPKGRAYCLTRMVRAGDDVLIDLEADLAEAILGQLRKYLMLFRGTSDQVLEDGAVIGLYGSPGAEQLAGAALADLKAPGDTLELPAGFLIRVEPTADGVPRFELWQPEAAATGLTEADEHTPADWQASDVAAGIARLTTETTEAFVPQMLNWQHLGGVHFKKGCYTGQEVIARMHFLGQLKKSLYRFRLAQAPAPSPGVQVVAGDKSVGTVVDAVGFTDGSAEVLAVVRHDAADGPLAIDGGPDQVLEPLPLPYPVPERGEGAAPDT